MYSGKISYRDETRATDGATYSCDKIQLVFRLRMGMGQEVLNDLGTAQWLNFDHWTSYKYGTYRNQFRVLCGPEGDRSFWLGVGMVAFGKSRPSDTCKVEFNPNKVGGERALHWLLRRLWGRARLVEPCTVKQWDLACDWPHPREWYSLRKDARLYEETTRSAADRTQYVGARNAPGRCKLYNKQAESHLDSPMTRLEITVAGLAGPHEVAALWPTVYRLQAVQGTVEVAALNDTDRFIFATLLDAPDRLNELGRRKRQKMQALLDRCQYRVAFDAAAYGRVLRAVVRWSERPAPDPDGGDKPRWEWPGYDPEFMPVVRWPDDS